MSREPKLIALPRIKKQASEEVELPKLQNIVSTANFKVSLDLREMAKKVAKAEYNPKKFSALILRIRQPFRSTALIFSSGKMVVTGTKSEEESKIATQSYAKQIKKASDLQIP